MSVRSDSAGQEAVEGHGETRPGRRRGRRALLQQVAHAVAADVGRSVHAAAAAAAAAAASRIHIPVSTDAQAVRHRHTSTAGATSGCAF